MCVRESQQFILSGTLYRLGTLGLIGTIKKVKHERSFEEQVRKRLSSRHK